MTCTVSKVSVWQYGKIQFLWTCSWLERHERIVGFLVWSCYDWLLTILDAIQIALQHLWNILAKKLLELRIRRLPLTFVSDIKELKNLPLMDLLKCSKTPVTTNLFSKFVSALWKSASDSKTSHSGWWPQNKLIWLMWLGPPNPLDLWIDAPLCHLHGIRLLAIHSSRGSFSWLGLRISSLR